MDLCLMYLASPFTVCYGMNVTALYREYFELTGDPVAASNLVVAAVHADQQPEETLLDSTAAAKILGVSKAQAQAMARNGQIRCIRVGKLMKFRREFLDEFLRPKPVKGTHW